ncbi:MAG: deoxyribose-phosphate aldolase [Gemmataceae bacterium]
MTTFTYSDLSKMIDHSPLVPTMTQQELEDACQLALAYDVASVCIMPYYLKRCAEILAGSTVKPTCTIGFPHGANHTSIKSAETKQAILDGGVEVDMVVNISQVLSGKWDYVRNDIAAVIDTAHAAGAKVKVIFENCYLKDEHKIRLCEICTALKADWVKTSTGYGTSGATLDDLALMKKHVPPTVKVKAAGGIRDLEMLLKALEMGVSRCGTSKTPTLLDPARERLGLSPIQFRGGTTAGAY